MAAENKVKKDIKEKKGSKATLIVVGVVVGLVLVGAVAFGAYYFAAKSITPVASTTESVASSKDSTGEVATFELDEFLINLADEGKPRYLKAKIFIGYVNGKELAAELTTKKPIIRDTVNNVLRTKKSTDLSVQGEEAIKKELADKINNQLTKGKISNVYFSEILIQ